MDRTNRPLTPRHGTAAPWTWRVVGLLISLAVAGCKGGQGDPIAPSVHAAPYPPPSPPPRAHPFRILFIGNSLTYANDLPGMVAALSRAAGDSVPIETESVAYGGYALEDHLSQGDAARAIERGGWDVVALQQGPSTLPESRANLIEYTRRFAGSIRGVGARPALYGVWPEKARSYALDACIESYRLAAESVDGLLFPAGLAWKTAWVIDASLPLYGPDDFHPSELGTYTAALVIYAVARGRSPVGLPTRFDLDGGSVLIDGDQARVAQRAAEEVTTSAPAIAPGSPAP